MVNKNLNIPLYIQIYNDLKNKIIENKYNEEFLPSERLLSEEYHVERATLRRALQLLVKDNLLIKVPGSGSKVNRNFSATPGIDRDASNNIAFILPGESIDKIYQPFIASLFLISKRAAADITTASFTPGSIRRRIYMKGLLKNISRESYGSAK